MYKGEKMKLQNFREKKLNSGKNDAKTLWVSFHKSTLQEEM